MANKQILNRNHKQPDGYDNTTLTTIKTKFSLQVPNIDSGVMRMRSKTEQEYQRPDESDNTIGKQYSIQINTTPATSRLQLPKIISNINNGLKDTRRNSIYDQQQGTTSKYSNSLAIPRMYNNNLSTNPSQVISNNHKSDYRQPPKVGINNRQNIKDIVIENNNIQFNNMPPINTTRLQTYTNQYKQSINTTLDTVIHSCDNINPYCNSMDFSKLQNYTKEQLENEQTAYTIIRSLKEVDVIDDQHFDEILRYKLETAKQQQQQTLRDIYTLRCEQFTHKVQSFSKYHDIDKEFKRNIQRLLRTKRYCA